MRVYGLTEVGRATEALMIALAAFGARFPPESELTRPGNLRAIAVPLQMALQAVVEEDAALQVELWIEGEAFTVRVTDGRVTVRAGAAADATVSMAVALEPMLSVLNGDLPGDELAAKHVEVRRADPADLDRFMGWMALLNRTTSTRSPEETG